MPTIPRVTPSSFDGTAAVDKLPLPLRTPSRTVTRGYVARIDQGPWLYFPRLDLAQQLVRCLSVAVGCEECEIHDAAVDTDLDRGARTLVVGPTLHLQHTASGDLPARYFGKI